MTALEAGQVAKPATATTAPEPQHAAPPPVTPPPAPTPAEASSSVASTAQESFVGQLPPGVEPGSKLLVTVPPGFALSGANMVYIVPERIPQDGRVQIPILAENIMPANGGSQGATISFDVTNARRVTLH